MFGQVIKDLTAATNEPKGTRLALGSKYETVEFSDTHYRAIQPQKQAITYVDGGNNPLFVSPSAELHYVRVASIGTSIEKKEFLVLARKTGTAITVKRYDTEQEYSLQEESLRTSIERVRKVAEIELAATQSGIIILDGTLEAHHVIEQQAYEKLFATNALIGAVAKTCSLVTDAGSSVVQALAKNEAWWYHPVAISNSDMHAADMSFCKLHPASEHVFRVEIGLHQKERFQELINALAADSKDVTFPGYPYGLVKVDRIARVSDREALMLQSRLQIASGPLWKTLGQDANALNAHSILDTM